MIDCEFMSCMGDDDLVVDVENPKGTNDQVAHAREGTIPVKTVKLNVPKIVPNTTLGDYYILDTMG